MESFRDGSKAGLLARLWGLRSFILRLAWLRVYTSHPYLSVFTRFDPLSPRLHRLLFVCAHVLCQLFLACFMYSYTNGVPGKPLQPDLPFPELVVLTLTIMTMSYLLCSALLFILSFASRAEFMFRYPFLAE